MKAVHVAHGLALQVPPAWRADVTELFVGPVEDGAAAHLVVTRDALDDAQGLAAYVDREAALLARRLPRFALEARTTRDVGGATACELSFTWVDGLRECAQRQLYLATPSRGVAVLTVTAAPGAAARLGDVLDALFASARAGR